MADERGFGVEGVVFLSSTEDTLDVFALGKTLQSLWAPMS